MPPNSEPLREKIQAAVADRLASIEAGVDFWMTPALVTRSLLSLKHYDAELQSGGPVYGVMRSSFSALAFQAQPTIYQDLVRFAVHAYVRMRTDTLAGTMLERAWEDHIRCLLADPFLGGLTLDLRPDETETDDGELEPAAWFRQGWIAEVSRDFA